MKLPRDPTLRWLMLNSVLLLWIAIGVTCIAVAA